MSVEELRHLSARKKAAILMLRLGPDHAGPLLRELRRGQMTQLVAEMASLGRVEEELGEAVMREFLAQAEHEGLPTGNPDTAFSYLQSTFGERTAREVMGELSGDVPYIPFQFIDSLEPEVVAENLATEQPQTIALVLSHLTPEQSAAIIAHLPSETVIQVGFRLGMMDRVTSDALQAVENGLKQRFSAVLENEYLEATGGVDSLVEVLSLVDKPIEEVVMSGLAEVDAALAAEVRAKMFVFADLQLLDDRQMQTVLRVVDAGRLPLALKGVSDVVKDKFLNNLSSRARENLVDEIELLGSVRMTDVEEAQKEILDQVRQLEESGEIIINRGGNDFVS